MKSYNVLLIAKKLDSTLGELLQQTTYKNRQAKHLFRYSALFIQDVTHLKV